jgi:response regulator RpfG family c-di-GMP phosphodiesterase
MSQFVKNQRHLARRFFTSLSKRPPVGKDIAWVNEKLLENEFELWCRMKPHDQRHSVEVARRFSELHPTFSRDEVAAALLHDIGKVHSELGVMGRVIATIVGPKGEKFRRYHEHELIGLNLCRNAGSSAETLRLLDWSTQESRNNLIVKLLRQADQI